MSKKIKNKKSVLHLTGNTASQVQYGIFIINPNVLFSNLETET